MLRLSFVTGSEPGKWLRRYEASTGHGLSARGSDDPLADLAAGECDLALLRLPDSRVGQDHHVVKLYDEAPGVAVPKESVYAEYAKEGEAVRGGDLAGEIVNLRFGPGVTIDEVRAALQVVAANVGVVYAPAPLLKVLSKKQIIPLTLAEGEGTATAIALVWRRDDDSDAIQDFVGVAKGRTVNSSRGSGEGGGEKSGAGGSSKAGKAQNRGSARGGSWARRASPPRARGRRRMR